MSTTGTRADILYSTLDHMLEGVQIIGFDGKYIYVNAAMARHGKYTEDEFIGCTILDKYPGIEQSDVYLAYQRCMADRVSIQLETKFTFPDSSEGWFELSFQPVPEGIVILSIDITERKKNEEKIQKLNEDLEVKVAERTALLEQHVQQLRESEAKFQKAFEVSAAGMSITRLADGRYANVNNSFAEITGFSREEVIGHTSVELGFVTSIERREEVLQYIRDHGYARNFEMKIRHRSGRIVDILSSTETIFLDGERYAINIIYDITERKQSEEHLAAVNKELEAFSFTVSHDLSAPLRIIKSYARMLEDDPAIPPDSKSGKLLQRIKAKAAKMSELIDALLTFSRLGKTDIHKSDIDMNQLVTDVVADLNRSMPNTTTIKAGPLHPACGDPTLIGQVPVNLIGNSIKYSAKAEHPVIEITSTVKDGKTIYTVKDNGEGFDMEYAGKLFGVFERMHTQEEFEGTGVGLATVKRIITKHGGEVWAEATPGGGAAFSFTLPGK